MSQLELKNQSNNSQVSCRSNQPLCSGKLQSSRSYVAGEVFLGKFTLVKNDFSLVDAFDAGTNYPEGKFQNQNHWNDVKRDKVKKFRFVVCTLALIALALSVMSRALLYIAIVEMTHQPIKDVSIIPTEPAAPHELDGEIMALDSGQESVSRLVKSIEFANDNVDDGSDHIQKIVSVFTVNDSDDENPEAGLHFSWSVKETNFLLSAFFIGYAPAMFFSGGVAEKYGSMPLLAMCVLGSAMINALTPFLAAFSYISLVASRVSLGLLQGPLVPACYDIFNRWLTVTEMNFMAPLIKVSMAVGTLAGTVLPGLVAHAGHEWTQNFYIGGLVCLVWAMLWFPLATSTPQTNRWIEEGELQRIFRKKSTVLAVIKVDNTKSRVDARSPEKKSAEKVSIPWMSIVLSPSVLALTFVKFTYNLGMDFVAIMSPIYLSQIHQATTETVALLASTGCIMQMLLITLVGGLATYVVRNETFGLTKTKWRKLFQGTSNFGVAFIYLLVPLVSPGNFVLVAGLLMMIYFFWMFGAGGETMVPYDLSPKYPATIMGFAHSLSILSGFVLPSVCSMILGDDKSVPARWNTLFTLISGASLLGGLVFVLVIKAKPFLPSERAKYDEARKEPLPNGSISK